MYVVHLKYRFDVVVLIFDPVLGRRGFVRCDKSLMGTCLTLFWWLCGSWEPEPTWLNFVPHVIGYRHGQMLKYYSL